MKNTYEQEFLKPFFSGYCDSCKKYVSPGFMVYENCPFCNGKLNRVILPEKKNEKTK